MSRKKSDTATAEETDWSFLEIPELVERLQTKAAGVVRDFGLAVDQVDELVAEAQLALAVRPRAVAEDIEKGGVGYVVHRARGFMVDRAKVEQARMNRQTSWDDLAGDEED